ncbi:MAG: tRNA dihydrouridine synthase DusB [Lachnospiraceae bacterium]|nr:tRNA dihydrouridine synthase DusB [Lachnospiraceae bacterium]
MKIGRAVIDPPVALAPMAGVTDKAYRLLCREMGCGLTVTEMVSAKAIYYKNRGTARLMEIEEAEHPVALQLFGSDPEIMAEIAAQVAEGPWDIIDVNMGCPVPKIVKNGEGSALMRDPELAGRIVDAMVRAQKKPVTVKFRKGFSEQEVNAVEFAKVLEANGASALTVHGRTREQIYSGKADRGIIRRVKEAVSIPVFGNGDVTDGASALAMFRETGCDGIMIGRAAQGDPWIFREVAAALRGEDGPDCGIALEERIRMMKLHAERLIALKGERTAMMEMRRHAAWYIAGLKGSAKHRRELNEVSDLQGFFEWLTMLSS